jgi:hypothetical protein
LHNLRGKSEERSGPGAPDPDEAKRLHAMKLAEVEERWSICGTASACCLPTMSRKTWPQSVLGLRRKGSNACETLPVR